MESNKENERRIEGISNIPVLIDPLPRSGRLVSRIQQQRVSKEVTIRDPLKTLSFRGVNHLAGPSSSLIQKSNSDDIAKKSNLLRDTLKNVHTQRVLQSSNESNQVNRVPQQKEQQKYESLHSITHGEVNRPKKLASLIPKYVSNEKVEELSRKEAQQRNYLRTIAANNLNLESTNLRNYNIVPKNVCRERGCDFAKEEFQLRDLKTTKRNLIDNKYKTTRFNNEKLKDNGNSGQSSLMSLTNFSQKSNSGNVTIKNLSDETQISKYDKETMRNEPNKQYTNPVTTQYVNSYLAGPNSKLNKCINKNDDKKLCMDDNIENLNKEKLLGASLMSVTSYFTPPLEVGTVKKVKKSLKRPHSRGLQSLPAFEIDLKQDAARKLNFNETVIETSDFHYESNVDNLTRCYVADAMKYLLSIEKKPSGSNIQENSRSYMVNYIMQVNKPGGNPAVAQSACWYLDSCVVDVPITVDQLKLTAAACFWIAYKFHEGGIHGMRMVRRAHFVFTVNDLATAEKNILRDLNFPTQPIVPHEFVPYLSWWCNTCNPGLIEAAADFLCQCGMTVCKALSQEFPSVIAAAAVKTALELLRMSEELKKLEQCPVFQAAKKKANNMSRTCSVLRQSVQKMVSVNYEYKSAFYQFSVEPYYIAPKIMCAAYFDDDDLMKE